METMSTTRHKDIKNSSQWKQCLNTTTRHTTTRHRILRTRHNGNNV